MNFKAQRSRVDWLIFLLQCSSHWHLLSLLQVTFVTQTEEATKQKEKYEMREKP
jgi:hypothetical protein